jgi:hypothetical protein
MSKPQTQLYPERPASVEPWERLYLPTKGVRDRMWADATRNTIAWIVLVLANALGEDPAVVKRDTGTACDRLAVQWKLGAATNLLLRQLVGYLLNNPVCWAKTENLAEQHSLSHATVDNLAGRLAEIGMTLRPRLDDLSFKGRELTVAKITDLRGRPDRRAVWTTPVMAAYGYLGPRTALECKDVLAPFLNDADAFLYEVITGYWIGLEEEVLPKGSTSSPDTSGEQGVLGAPLRSSPNGTEMGKPAGESVQGESLGCREPTETAAQQPSRLKLASSFAPGVGLTETARGLTLAQPGAVSDGDGFVLPEAPTDPTALEVTLGSYGRVDASVLDSVYGTDGELHQDGGRIPPLPEDFGRTKPEEPGRVDVLRDVELLLPPPGRDGKPRTDTRRRSTSKRREKSQARQDRLERQFREHYGAENWREVIGPDDLVHFFRLAWTVCNGSKAPRVSYPRELMVANMLLEDHGADQATRIIIRSLVHPSDPPKNMGWYQSGWLGDLLESSRWSYVAMDAEELFAEIEAVLPFGTGPRLDLPKPKWLLRREDMERVCRHMVGLDELDGAE